MRLPTSAEIRLGRPRKAPTIENAKLFTVKSIHKTIDFSSHNALFSVKHYESHRRHTSKYPTSTDTEVQGVTTCASERIKSYY